MAKFGGFPDATRNFLEGIAANNSKDWFEANRALYDEGYVAPGRSFVEAIGPQLRKLSPTVQFEPRINGSISRVNRDTRFSRDKRPYKDHLDIVFWHGEKKGWDQPGFFIRLSRDAVWMGCGMHHIEGDRLERLRDAIVDDRAGAALAATIAGVEAAGDYVVGMPNRKQVPRGYDKDHPRANLLLFESLTAMCRLTLDEALAPDFGDAALENFRATWPVGAWMMAHLEG